MAKIYETKEDFERLKEQVSRLQTQATIENSGGFAALGGSFIIDALRTNKSETRGWQALLNIGLLATSVILMVKSLFTSSKAHTLDLQRERMGPENIVLPPDAIEKDDKGCGCGLKKFARSAPLSLLEQAEKPGFQAEAER